MTTKSVADLAGVSVGSLYQYFPNKQAILAEIIRRRTHEIVSAILAAAADAVSLDELSDAIIKTFLAEKRRKVALSRALRDPMAEINGVEIMRDAARNVISELEQLVAGQIGRSLTANEQHRLALLTVAAVEGAVTALISTRPEALVETETRDGLIRMFRAGLGSFD